VFDEFGALVGTCGIARDVSDAVRRAEETERWALQDPLTNLPNRRALVDRIEVVLGKTRRSGFHAGLLFVDLDDFKRINDLYGHAGGDAVLVEVAKRIQSVLRAADTVARIGGDEFVVLLDQIGADRVAALTHARGVGEKLLAALANIDAGAALSCSASVGLLVFSDGVHSVEEILHRADHAMYEAKKAGKNQLAIVED
jgi:diguanylate cyclase (GGDEF)-like protein